MADEPGRLGAGQLAAHEAFELPDRRMVFGRDWHLFVARHGFRR
jgi:hypothetical protein